MLCRSARAAAVLLWALALLPVYAQRPANPDRHVLLISIDGMMPDYYLNADELGLKIPNLRRFLREGTYAKGAISVLPSVTFPAHTSMITGVNPRRHGILNNFVFDPDSSLGGGWQWFYRDLKMKTLFDAAKAANLRTAAVTWPVTVGAPIDMNLPDLYPTATLREAKMLLSLASGEGLDSILPPAEALVRLGDDVRTKVTLHFIRFKPHFMAVHFLELDGAQHRYGPMSSQAFQVLERIDGYLGEIVKALQDAGILESSTIIIASDHGFMAVEKVIRPGTLLTSLGLIKLDKDGKVLSWAAFPWSGGGTLAIYIHPQAPAGTAKKVDDIVNLLLTHADYGVKRAYRSEEVEKMGGFQGAYVVLEAREGFWFSNDLQGDLISGADTRGMHGYPPERPEMKASFLIKGPDIRVSNRIEKVRLIDIAPTIAHILGLKLDGVEGRVLNEVFKAGVPALPTAQKAP